MKQTIANRIAEIINELQDVAEKRISQSPEWYLDHAQQLASLWLGITEDLVKYEMLYKKEVVDLIEQGNTVSKAELMVQCKSDNYKAYQYLRKKDAQVAEMIKLAKKRIELDKYEKM